MPKRKIISLTKWEYAEFKFNQYGKQKFVEFLNEIGDLGWEIFNMKFPKISEHDGDDILVYSKRAYMDKT